MIGPLVAAALSCPMFKFENKTDVWNERDQQTLVYVTKEGCRKQYSNSPCLKIFVKVEESVYNVICGPEERRK